MKKFFIVIIESIVSKKIIKAFKFSLFTPLIFILIILLGACDENSKPGSLEVDISPSRGTQINFTISNTGSSGLLFLNHDIPINGHNKPYFKVTTETGDEVPYRGRLVSIDLDSSHWTMLEAGENIRFSVDLFQAYGFSLSDEKYSISYVSSVTIISNSDSIEKLKSQNESLPTIDDIEHAELISNEIKVDIDVSKYPAPPLIEERGCSSSNFSEVGESFNYAELMTSRSIDYMKKNGMNNLWNTWWGSANSSRFEFIKDAHEDIVKSFEKTWKWTCPSSTSNDCDPGVNAWVYKGSPYRVWLCPRFFSAHGKTGQGSILIHEASHWFDVLGTDDHVYGESGCKSLAKNSPNKAKMNADNYRFFTIYASKEPVNKPPVASYNYTTNYLKVQFTDTSTDPENKISSRNWDFGDNKTSTETNPSHTYSQAGTYKVRLKVTDQGGLSHTHTKSITVEAPPVQKYTLTVNKGSGDGQYVSGQVVTISADPASDGKIFDKWIISSGQASIADITESESKLTIPSGNVVITASYKEMQDIPEIPDIGCGSFFK